MHLLKCVYYVHSESFQHYLTLTALSLSVSPRTDNSPIQGLTLHLLSFLNLSLPLYLSPLPSDLKYQRSDLVRRCLKLWLRVCVMFVCVCMSVCASEVRKQVWYHCLPASL